MPATYLETIEKLQQQGLETLKQAQAAQIATLTSIREIAASVPLTPAVPSLDKLPTFAELTELSQTFAAVDLRGRAGEFLLDRPKRRGRRTRQGRPDRFHPEVDFIRQSSRCGVNFVG